MRKMAMKALAVTLMLSPMMTANVLADEAALNQRIDRLERIIKGQGLVSLLGRVDQLQNEIQRLNGENEALHHELDMMNKRQRDLYLDIDQRLSNQSQVVASTPTISTPVTMPNDVSGAVSSEPISPEPVITEPTALLSSTTFIDVSCFGAGDGSIDLTVTGGTAPYTYLWSPGALTVEDPTNLVPDGYSVLVTDGNGCTSNAAASITEPAALTALVDQFTNETTPGANDGTITVTPSGGDLPYSPSWTGPGIFTSTSLALVNLEPGTYNLTLTDASGCEFTLTQVILPAPVGIQELINDVEFNVYPNPNTGQFIVELNNLDGDEYKLEIRNIIGQLVVNETVNDSNGNFYKKMTLDTGTSGVYFISLVSNDGKVTKKLVIY